MPTYEYACTECGNHVEVVQSFADEPLVTCGVCGGRLRRVFHPVGVLFKGSGFYSTDARSRKSLDSSAKKDGGKAAASQTKSESDQPKSESKSDKAASDKAS